MLANLYSAPVECKRSTFAAQGKFCKFHRGSPSNVFIKHFYPNFSQTHWSRIFGECKEEQKVSILFPHVSSRNTSLMMESFQVYIGFVISEIWWKLISKHIVNWLRSDWVNFKMDFTFTFYRLSHHHNIRNILDSSHTRKLTCWNVYSTSFSIKSVLRMLYKLLTFSTWKSIQNYSSHQIGFFPP